MDYEELSSIRPKKKGNIVMCVPFSFKVVKQSPFGLLNDGKKAIPTMPEKTEIGMTKSGFLAFASEEEALECLEELEKNFTRKGITNFKDIKKAALLSKDMLKQSRIITGSAKDIDIKASFGGKVSCESCIFQNGKLIPFTAKSTNDLVHINWYKNLGMYNKSLSQDSAPGNKGILKASRLNEEDETMVIFTVPHTNMKIKASVSILKEYEAMCGKNIDSKSCSTPRGFSLARSNEIPEMTRGNK